MRFDAAPLWTVGDEMWQSALDLGVVVFNFALTSRIVGLCNTHSLVVYLIRFLEKWGSWRNVGDNEMSWTRLLLSHN